MTRHRGSLPSSTASGIHPFVGTEIWKTAVSLQRLALLTSLWLWTLSSSSSSSSSSSYSSLLSSSSSSSSPRSVPCSAKNSQGLQYGYRNWLLPTPTVPNTHDGFTDTSSLKARTFSWDFISCNRCRMARVFSAVSPTSAKECSWQPGIHININIQLVGIIRNTYPRICRVFDGSTKNVYSRKMGSKQIELSTFLTGTTEMESINQIDPNSIMVLFTNRKQQHQQRQVMRNSWCCWSFCFASQCCQVQGLLPKGSLGFWGQKPWKINMEPTNHPFRKENDLPGLHGYFPC